MNNFDQNQMYQINSAKFEYFHESYRRSISLDRIGNRYKLSATECMKHSDSCEILYYESTAISYNRPIFLIIPSFFNSPEILFLNSGINFVDHLRESGAVYIINWLEVKNENFGLGNYVDEALGVLSLLNNQSSKKVNLIGHCIGGNLAVAATILMPNLIQNLTLLTVPWDFSHFSLISDLHKKFDLDKFVKSLPQIPKIYIKILFFLLFPDYFKVKLDKYFNFKLETDKQLFMEIEHWLMSGSSIARDTYLQIVNDMMCDNFLIKKKWVINNTIIDLDKINNRTFIVVTKNDQLVPYTSIQPMIDCIKNLKIIKIDGGHISYLIGKNIKSFFTPYKPWLKGEI